MNKIIKSFSILTLALTAILSTGTVKAHASEQGEWVQTSGSWSFYYDGRIKAVNTIIDGKYAVDSNGAWDGVTLGTIKHYIDIDTNGYPVVTSPKTYIFVGSRGDLITTNNKEKTMGYTLISDNSNNDSNVIKVESATTTASSENTISTGNNSATEGTISYAEFTKIADDRMLELINAHRQENGVAPLTWDQTLADTSTEKCNHMIKHDYMGHSYKNSATIDIQEVCYSHNIDSENCLANYSYDIAKSGAIALANSMFNQWKASPEHNRNMLNSDWRKVGFGFSFANGTAQYASYGTQQFAVKHNGYEEHKTLGRGVPHSLADFN